MPVQDLNQIISDCKKGKALAQKQIYNAFAPKMFGICLSYCKDRTEAEDCLQEGFIKVFTKINHFTFKGSFEGWVRRIIVNTVIESFRKKQTITLFDELPLHAVEEDETVDSESPISEEEIRNCIQELPSKYKMVFNLYVLEGFSHDEISQSLDISIGTSKSNLSRARQWLKKRIEEKISVKNKAIC